MVESPTHEKQFKCRKNGHECPSHHVGITAPSPTIKEIPKCVSWSVKWKEHVYTCWKERGLALTKCWSPFRLLDLWLSQKLQQESYAVPSGYIWGKMTYTGKYVTSLFKNFKLYLKRLFSCPVMYTVTKQLQCHIRTLRENCPWPHPEQFRLTEVALVLTHLGPMRKGLLRGPALGCSCIPPELAASQKLRNPCP